MSVFPTWIVVIAAIIVAIIIYLVAYILFRQRGRRKYLDSIESDWQRQAYPYQQPGEWTTPNSDPQPGGWGAPSAPQSSASAWGQQTSAWGEPAADSQLGGWGSQTANQQASSWGTPKSDPQPGGWGVQPAPLDTPWGQPAAEPQASSWSQPVTDSPAPAWGQPTYGSQASSWNQPVADSRASAWGQPAANPQASSWNQPVTDSPASAWGAQIADPWSAPQEQSWKQPASESQVPPWGQPVAKPQAPAWGDVTTSSRQAQQEEENTTIPIKGAFPSLPRPTIHIFISHSSKDDEFGTRLVQDLRQAVSQNSTIWYDSDGGLNPGDSWFKRIEEAIVAHDKFLIILSPNSMDSDWVRREYDIALNEKKSIIPILHQECTSIWPSLRTIHYISFLHPKRYETALNELLTTLGLSSDTRAKKPKQ